MTEQHINPHTVAVRSKLILIAIQQSSEKNDEFTEKNKINTQSYCNV